MISKHRGRRGIFCVFAILFLQTNVFAADHSVTSKTYFKYYRDARDEKYAPLYEYVELESRNLRDGQVSFYVSGWLGHDFESRQYDEKTRDELTYAFVRFAPSPDRKLLVSAGRQYVFEGVASEQVDGVAARWEFLPSTGVSLFGGAPVETEFDSRRGDAVYGGRVFQRIRNRAEVGVSVLSESNKGNRYREEGGVDLWLKPHKRVEVKGQSTYNNLTEGWREHSYNIRVSPAERLILSLLYADIRYDDAFFVTTLSAFSPDFLGRGERLRKQGGMIDYRVNDRWSGSADYTRYEYRSMGDADSYGGKVSLRAGSASTGLSLHRMDGAAERLRYLEARAFAAIGGESWRFSLDAINLEYDARFNNLRNAYTVNGTLRYDLTEAVSSGLSVDYSRTPDFDNNTTALLNITVGYQGGK